MLIYGNIKNQYPPETMVIKTFGKIYDVFYKINTNSSFPNFYFLKEWEVYKNHYIESFIETEIDDKKLKPSALFLINVSIAQNLQNLDVDFLVGYGSFLMGYMVVFLVIAENSENYFIFAINHNMFIDYTFNKMTVKKIRKNKNNSLDLHILLKEVINRYKNGYKKFIEKSLFFFRYTPFDMMYKENDARSFYICDTYDNLINKDFIYSKKNNYLTLKNNEGKEEKFLIKLFVYDKYNITYLDKSSYEIALYKRTRFARTAIYFFLFENKKRKKINIIKTYTKNNKLTNYKNKTLNLHEVSEIKIDRNNENDTNQVSFIIVMIDSRKISDFITDYVKTVLNQRLAFPTYTETLRMVKRDSVQKVVKLNTERYILFLPCYKENGKKYELFFISAKNDKYILIIFSRIVSVHHQTYVFYFYGAYSYMIYDAKNEDLYLKNLPLEILEPTMVMVEKEPIELFYSYYKLAGNTKDLIDKDTAIEFYFYLKNVLEIFLSFKILFFYDMSLVYSNNIDKDKIVKIYDVISNKYFGFFQEKKEKVKINLKKRILYLRQLYDFDTNFSVIYIMHRLIKNKTYRVICIIGNKELIDKIRTEVINKKELDFECFYFYSGEAKSAHKKGIRYNLNFYIADNSYNREKINNLIKNILK